MDMRKVPERAVVIGGDYEVARRNVKANITVTPTVYHRTPRLSP
jgi:hypothetical protein